MRQIVLIAHDIRSTHNIGSLLRTAEGLGVAHVYITGYSPYPKIEKDDRLPHIAEKLTKQIDKTALGATESLTWSHEDDAGPLLKELRDTGYQLVALEQSDDSLPLPTFQPSEKIAILLGREVEGIEPRLLQLVDTVIEIPMFGQKESFNVVQAAAMILFHCRFAG